MLVSPYQTFGQHAHVFFVVFTSMHRRIQWVLWVLVHPPDPYDAFKCYY